MESKTDYENVDFNEIVPLKYRQILNTQQNRIILEGTIDEKGRITQPYRYVMGLGETHFKQFEKEINKLIDLFPWIKKKHVKFVLNELILNSQLAMLREVVHKIREKKQAAGYFYITIYVNNEFFSAGIDEYGDFFDYYGYMENPKNFDDFNSQNEDAYNEKLYDEMSEECVTGLLELSTDNLKLILTHKDKLVIPDGSNKIGLNIIESATDHDFYITSFYKDKKYMWKRIYFRIENDTA